MAETSTARIGLIQWGASTDSPSRVKFNTAFATIDNLVARSEQGTRAARPAAGIRDRYYFATDTDIQYRDDGTGWNVVGAQLEGGNFITNQAAGDVGLTVKAAASPTGDLTRWTSSAAAILAKVDAKGSIFSGTSAVISSDTAQGQAGFFQSTATANKALVAKGFAGQTGDLQQWQDSSAAVLAKIASTGAATFTGLTSTNGITITGGTVSIPGFTSGGSSTLADVQINPTAGGATPSLQVDGVGGQTNLQTWRDASDVVVGLVTLAGAAQHTSMGVGVAPAAGTKLLVQSGATTDRVLAVKGIASQSGSLTEWVDSANTVLVKVTSAGILTTFANASVGTDPIANTRLTVVTTAAQMGLVVRGAASQTANLQEWRDSTDAILARVEPDGDVGIGVSVASTSLAVSPRAAGNVGVVVRGFASQTANLQEWQSSTPTTLALVSSAGRGAFAGGAAGGTTGTLANVTNIMRSVATTSVALIAQGITSQTADLLQILDPANAVLAKFNSAGVLSAPTAVVQGTSAAVNVLTVQGAASQTAKLVTAKNSSNVELFTVNNIGKVGIAPVVDDSTPGLLIKNASSGSTAPLIQAQTFDGSQNLATISAAGDFTIKTIQLEGFFGNDLIHSTDLAFIVDSNKNLILTGRATAGTGMFGNTPFVSGTVVTVRQNTSTDRMLYLVGRTDQTGSGGNGDYLQCQNTNAANGDTTAPMVRIDRFGSILATDFQTIDGGTFLKRDMGESESTSDATGTTGVNFHPDLYFSVSNMKTSRRYRVTHTSRIASSGVAATISVQVFRQAGGSNPTAASAVIAAYDTTLTIAGGPGAQSITISKPFKVPTNGQHTFGIAFTRTAGAAGTMTMSKGNDPFIFLMVEDMGPASS